jgi:DNA-binding transcriptional LysR family regulator
VADVSATFSCSVWKTDAGTVRLVLSMVRDQALSFCSLRRVDNIDTFGASNLSTIVQMVANGLGMTLLPETEHQAGMPQ